MSMSGPPTLPPVDGDGDVPHRVAMGAPLEGRPATNTGPLPPIGDSPDRRLLEACSAGQEGPAAVALGAGADPAVTDRAGQTALHLVGAVRHDPEATARLVRLLLDWGAPLESSNAKGQTPVLQAADVGNTAALLVLAELGAACDATDERDNTLLHLAAGSGNPQTVAAALDRLPIEALQRVNKAGNTPLQVAKNRETARPLLDAGAQADEPTTLLLLERMPSAVPDVLNHYMTTNDQPLDSSQLEVYLDYTPFWDANRKAAAPETALLRAIVNADQNDLLKHPVVETFMHTKWLQIQPYFYFNFVFYACFALLVTAYGMLRVIHPDETVTHVVGWLAAAFTTLTSLRELLQLSLGLRAYFGSVDNWLELVVLTLITALLVTPDARHAWVNHAVAWLMLATWLEVTLMIGRLPSVGIYIYMFVRVAQRLVGFLLLYSPLLVAFALSFRVLFGGTDAFKGIPLSLIKTFVMMMGEYEYNSIFIDDSPLYLGTSHLLMVLFIVSMPIITVNLLIGLTVNDIQSVFVTAGVKRLRITVIQILLIESIVYSNVLHKICCMQFYRRYLEKLTVLPRLFSVSFDKHLSERPAVTKGNPVRLSRHEPNRGRQVATEPEQGILRAAFRPNVRGKPRLYRRDDSGRLQPSDFVMQDWMLKNMLRLLQEREFRAGQESSERQQQAQRLAELRARVTAAAQQHRPEGTSGGSGQTGPQPTDRLEQKLETMLSAMSELSVRVGLLERQLTSRPHSQRSDWPPAQTDGSDVQRT